MGRFLRETVVKVALVGIRGEVITALTERLHTRQQDDAGAVETTPFQDLVTCYSAIERDKITAVCITPSTFGADECTRFIANVRVTHPLVPLCLVDDARILKEMPGFHPKWQARLAHFFKLEQDTKPADFNENAGVIRDLLVADAVKCRALGQYDTTPGAVVRLRNAAPHGFWLGLITGLMCALISGVAGPVVNHFLPPNTPGNAAPMPGSH